MTDNATLNVPVAETPANNQPRSIKFFAHLVSFIFHPLFIPTYIAAFLLFLHPYAFAGVDEQRKTYRLLSVFIVTAFFPAFSVFLMRQLRFIDTIYLRTQKDRIIPYITCMVYYFWAWYVAKNIHDSPEFVAMLLSTFVCCIAGMMANIYFKISMHGLATGALFVLFIWIAFTGATPLGLYLAIATFITGLVCTARFIVSDHSPFEVYAGLVIGGLCQAVSIAIAA